MSSTLIESIRKIITNLNLIKNKGPVGNRNIDFLEDGQKLFDNFCLVGCQATREKINKFKDANSNDIKSLSKETVQLISDNKDWLLLYLCDYTDTIIVDPDYFLKRDQLVVRSGIQFMFDLFSGIDIPNQRPTTSVDSIFDYLKFQTIEDIDTNIKNSKENYFNIKKSEIPEGVPASHHWWF
jgi:hypothetical protein